MTDTMKTATVMSRMETTPDAKWGMLLYFYMFTGRVLDWATTYVNIYLYGEVEANPYMAGLIPYPHLFVSAQLLLLMGYYALALLFQRQLTSLFKHFRVKNPDKKARLATLLFATPAWIGFINNTMPGRPLSSLLYPP